MLVACLENELVAFVADTGARAGGLRTSAEIRTPPIVAGGHVVLGLRDRSVIAYALPGTLPPVSGARLPRRRRPHRRCRLSPLRPAGRLPARP